MNQWPKLLVATWIVSSSASAISAENVNWALKAGYVDACSCDLTCPCIFGGSSTHGYCKGATLVEIKEGHYGHVDLSGVTVLAVYNAGSWIKFLVSDNATEEQTETVAEFLPVAEGFFDSPLREVRNAPISVARTEDTVKISTEGTIVELELIRGLAGEPIKVEGLPAHGFPGLPYLNHTQYKTVTLSHDSENETYNFSGTNGYTAEINASSETVKSLNMANAEISEITDSNGLVYTSKRCGLSARKQHEVLESGLQSPSPHSVAAFGQ